ncbi:Mg/Co/Ni transporter MgtE [Candidatus Termititenax persephonae]|uniref:Magnesium transporter MgtE n=1 Tax=Candidatus Termititenax persephonae TaxID=2218525 RepID=A0A388TIG1_9BACT|nr:Mg/Co/Ni transporter MgtE [Candidatus Termititenax persephonae]
MAEEQIIDQTLIKEHNWREVRKVLERNPPPAVADLLMHLDKSAALIVFKILPREFAAEVFAYLDPAQKDAFLSCLSDKEAQQIISELTPDDRTELFSELPAEVTRRVLQLLPPQDFKEVSLLLGYPEHSVGRMMTPNYVICQPDWTVAKTLRNIREKGKDSETINMVYVVDEQGHLLDDIKLRRIIMSQPKTRIKKICDNTFVSLSAFDDQESALQMIKKYDLIALPVVDSKGILIGIVTIDDLMDVQDVHVTEDIYKGAGIQVQTTDLLATGNIKTVSVRLLYQHRIGWLVSLVFMNLFSGAALAHFSGVIQKHIVLVFFLPLLIGSGGNSGSQAATLAIRSLATGDVKLSDWFKLLYKELLVAALLGLTMAVMVYIIGYMRGGLAVALITFLTMIGIIVLSSLIGISLPFIFTKFKLDPATASSPIIASLADIMGVVIYFSIALGVLKFF